MAPFEQRLWEAEWPEAMQPEGRTGKIVWIDTDLRHAGMSDDAISALPTATYRPSLNNLAERFGIAYVIEGAQLGGLVLRKALAPALNSWSPRWLEGYGSDTSRKWKVFMECAEQCLVSEEERKLAGNAAREAFSSLVEWLDNQEVTAPAE